MTLNNQVQQQIRKEVNMEKKFYFRPICTEPVYKGVYANPEDDIAGYKLVAKAKSIYKEPSNESWTEQRVRDNYGRFNDKDADKQLVFGWANVTVDVDGEPPIDWHGDVIKSEDLEVAAYNYVLNWGTTGIEHVWDTDCGWVVESVMFTKEKMAAMGIPEGTIPEGWWIGFYIPDPVVYKKVKDGEFEMFSIQGYGRRVAMDGSDYCEY